MSSNIKGSLTLLNALNSAQPRLRKAILSTGGKQLILAISEIVKNVLLGNVKLTSQDIKKLGRYKKVLRTLATRKPKLAHRRRLLVQHGGFLPTLIGPALSILASLLL